MRLPGLFISGTDTGVGKTWIAAAIVRALRQRGHRIAVQKPVATGARLQGDSWTSDDTLALIDTAQDASAEPIPPGRVTPFLFEEPLAPSLAARRAGQPLTLESIRKAVSENLAWWSSRADVAVIEGVGGLLCPLAEDARVLELALALDYPLLVVARFGLGTLNHTLLTVHVAQTHGLRVVGVILNQAEPQSWGLAEQTAAEELSRFLPDVPVLAENLFQHDSTLLCPAIRDLDWYERASSGRQGS